MSKQKPTETDGPGERPAGDAKALSGGRQGGSARKDIADIEAWLRRMDEHVARSDAAMAQYTASMLELRGALSAMRAALIDFAR